MKYKINAKFLFWGGALMAGVSVITGLQAGGAIAIAVPPIVFVLCGIASGVWGFITANSEPVNHDQPVL